MDSVWKEKLSDEFKKPYIDELRNFIRKEYADFKCFPPKSQIFAAFDNCPWDKLKVVIIGQDPYHGEGQAHGLSFSVNDGIPFPPSLQNIFKEIENDVGKEIPKSGNLTSWAKQGVLLLNATLTVRSGQANSHQNMGWERFTDAVIQKIATEKEGIVFLLWGSYAKKKQQLIDAQKHKIFTSGHPSPLSANRGFWFGNKHFSKCNEYLSNRKLTPIEW